MTDPALSTRPMGLSPLRALLVAIGFLVTLATTVLAQETPGDIDYEDWERTATRAEEVVAAGRASNEALEALRVQIADWRQQFLDAQTVNATRIETVQNQIDTLGPVPEDGTEPEDIAARRSDLNAQLSDLRAPVLRAEEAYSRADGLIREIDAIIRDRQARDLTRLGPSPLNPVYWRTALESLSGALDAIWTELRAAITSPTLRTELRNNAPAVVMLLVVGFVLLLRGKRWVEGWGTRLRKQHRRGMPVWSFLVSLGQIALPMVGVMAFASAFYVANVLGVRSEPIVVNLPLWALILLGFRWLGGRLFPKHEEENPLNVPTDYFARARWNIAGLALMVVIQLVIELLTRTARFDEATVAVLTFPVLVIAAFLLFGLARLILMGLSEQGASTESEHPGVRNRMLRLLGRAAMLIAVLSPILAALGYGTAAHALLFPAIQTLAVMGLLLVVQRFLSDVYGYVSGQGEAAREALLPVLVGFLLVILAVPVIALIWGARVADLTELWAQFREGFAIGETRISPTDFLTFVVVFALGYMLTRLVQGTLAGSILPKTKIDPGGQNAIVSGMGYVGVFLAAIIAITTAGIDLSSLAIVAGALSVGIGFGLQNIVSNFVSGIILLIERPISEGDWIEVSGQHGIVKDISVRSTVIETFDRFDVIIPNADLVSGQVNNYTRANVMGRIIVSVGVAYGTDTRKVEQVLLGIAREHPMVLMNPAPYVYFSGFGADSMDFEIRAILRDVNATLGVRTEMNHQIVERFAEEGIEIPFAQRDVWLRNPEVLVQGGKTDQTGPKTAETDTAQTAQATTQRMDPPDDPDTGSDADAVS